ncbi:MAG: hypothetical protein WCS91_05030, partial [Bacilli bacterium]
SPWPEKKALTKECTPIDVLPGIDEWNASPWPEKKTEEEKPVVEEKPVEKKEENPVMVKVADNGAFIVADNTAYPTRKRPQERVNPDAEKNVGEPEGKGTIVNNAPLGVDDGPKKRIRNSWNSGDYIPEEKKPVAPVAPAVKPVPSPIVKPMAKPGAPFAPVGIHGKPHPAINPIQLVTPIKKEEEPVVEEKPEEKKLTAVAGPVHAIHAPAPKGAITPVAPRHVKFELAHYKIKTYEGELSAEQAFSMGVTKVQPMAMPVFAGEDNSALSSRKRREQIQKEGIFNVNQKTSDFSAPVAKPTRPVADYSAATSIRDLVKANKKADEEVAAAEEKKPEAIKPQAPLKPVKPVAPTHPFSEDKPKEEVKKPEEKPVAKIQPVIPPVAPVKKPFGKPNGPIHPIAPIAPKPVKPMKPVDPKDKK